MKNMESQKYVSLWKTVNSSLWVNYIAFYILGFTSTACVLWVFMWVFTQNPDTACPAEELQVTTVVTPRDCGVEGPLVVMFCLALCVCVCVQDESGDGFDWVQIMTKWERLNYSSLWNSATIYDDIRMIALCLIYIF